MGVLVFVPTGFVVCIFFSCSSFQLGEGQNQWGGVNLKRSLFGGGCPALVGLPAACLSVTWTRCVPFCGEGS